MRDHQTGALTLPDQPLPQQPLGLDIQHAGKIVAHRQLWLAHQHACGGRALDLAAGEPRPAAADQRGQAVLQCGQIGVEHGCVQHALELGLADRQPLQDVVAQALAEQPWPLRRVGHAGRHKKDRQPRDRLAVPADLTAARQQPEQHPQQGGLSGSDPAGDHRDRSWADVQVDRADAPARSRIAEHEPAQIQRHQTVGRAARGRVERGQPAAQGDRAVFNQCPARRGGDDLAQPVERDLRLLVARPADADKPGVLGQHRQILREQREIAHAEAARAHGLGRDNQDRAGADADDVGVDGAKQRLEG